MGDGVVSGYSTAIKIKGHIEAFTNNNDNDNNNINMISFVSHCVLVSSQFNLFTVILLRDG